MNFQSSTANRWTKVVITLVTVPDTNEFPKKIIYKLQNDTLKANVSTTEFDVDFEFVEIQK